MSNYTQKIKVADFEIELAYVPFSKMSYIKKLINDFLYECYDIPEEDYDEVVKPVKGKAVKVIDERRSYGFVIMRNIAKVTASYGEKLTAAIEPAISTIEGKPGSIANIEMLCSLLDPVSLNEFLGHIRDFEIDIEDKKKLFSEA